ncbi:hypothetical protein [Actinomadura craniellae]|nr:hypothetical protein [Actinomadura craniellae]
MTPTARWAVARRRKRLVITRTVLERTLWEPRQEEPARPEPAGAVRVPAA